MLFPSSSEYLLFTYSRLYKTQTVVYIIVKSFAFKEIEYAVHFDHFLNRT